MPYPFIQRIIEDTRCKEVAVSLGICVTATETRPALEHLAQIRNAFVTELVR
jgi:hypothetical protein